MDFKRLETTIMRDEGFRARPYLDSVGVPTIGYGTTRVLGAEVSMDDPAISAQSARILLRADIYGACIDAAFLFPSFWIMCALRREVLVNMAYNLGLTGLSKFKRMRRAVTEQDYVGASEEMLDSLWADQVGSRAVRLSSIMRSGDLES